MSFLQEKLLEREKCGLVRTISSPTGLIDLTSNDYLGLASCVSLQADIAQEIEKVNAQGLPFGATGSRLLTGNNVYVESVEAFVASFHKTESALLYASGYIANIGLLSAIAGEKDLFLYDLDVHASMYDGMRLSKAKMSAFRHNDLVHLESRLKAARYRQDIGNIFVCAESIYSMSGDFAPLQEMCEICDRYEAYLIVDEAHSTGVVGDKGEGLVQQLNLENRVFARVHTFGKALGIHGAAVLGTRLLKEYLINFSRAFIYTTALPLSFLASIRCAYTHIIKADEQRKNLTSLIAFFKRESEKRGITLPLHSNPVQPIYMPGNKRVRAVSEHLVKLGLDVRAILPPTVKRGRECLRVCLHAFNKEEELLCLLNNLS